MKYKALMLDVDGTIVPYDYQALPSENLKKAIHKAQESITVCIVTGRSFASIKKILDHLEMTSGFVVVNNGAHVIDIATKEVLYEQLISASDTQEILSIFKREGIPFAAKGSPFKQEYVRSAEQEVPKDMTPPMIFTEENFTSEKIDSIIEQLSHLSTISCHKTHHKNPNLFGILISHTNATKQHGIYELEKHLGITREEMIGAGDSYNDFPLLMACGLKVAMGNAIDDLKAIADFVAPTVFDDGIVTVIDKFILTQQQD